MRECLNGAGWDKPGIRCGVQRRNLLNRDSGATPGGRGGRDRCTCPGRKSLWKQLEPRHGRSLLELSTMRLACQPMSNWPRTYLLYRNSATHVVKKPCRAQLYVRRISCPFHLRGSATRMAVRHKAERMTEQPPKPRRSPDQLFWPVKHAFAVAQFFSWRDFYATAPPSRRQLCFWKCSV